MLYGIIPYCSKVLLIFLVWTFTAYWIHRLAHIHHRKNPLWRIHSEHHRGEYFPSTNEMKFQWPQLIFWHGNFIATLDVYLTLTLPALILAVTFPLYGMPILAFHYFYEVFLSGSALDHNIRMKGVITRFFAWGGFHLYHHVHLQNNYGLLITLWDYVFRTSHIPPDDFVEDRIKFRQAKGKVSKNFILDTWPNGTVFGSSVRKKRSVSPVITNSITTNQ